MLTTSVFWGVFALLVCWAIGAYNRLVRLRAAVVRAFGSLDAQLLRLMTMLAECELTQTLSCQGAPETRNALQAAVTQMGVSLAEARARPLQPEAAAALSAATAALDAAWHANWRNIGAQSAEPSMAICAALWEQHKAETAPAIEQFNAAVARYNAAMTQFPAVILARLFGFKAASVLQSF